MLTPANMARAEPRLPRMTVRRDRLASRMALKVGLLAVLRTTLSEMDLLMGVSLLAELLNRKWGGHSLEKPHDKAMNRA